MAAHNASDTSLRPGGRIYSYRTWRFI